MPYRHFNMQTTDFSFDMTFIKTVFNNILQQCYCLTATFRLTAVACLCFLFTDQAYSQSFIDRLRKTETGKGSVIVIQDEEITRLVNGKSRQYFYEEPKRHSNKRDEQPKRDAASLNLDDANEISLGDVQTTAITSQKPYRRSYTMQGYRIQIYSGDDSRNARRKAYLIGNRLKNIFPELPVYTHFYSPHWTCRVGDFKTYQEASSALNQIKETGSFKAAAIIKSKIQVRL